MSQLQAFLELRAQQRSGEALFFVDFIEMLNFLSKAAGNQADHLEKYIINTYKYVFFHFYPCFSSACHVSQASKPPKGMGS